MFASTFALLLIWTQFVFHEYPFKRVFVRHKFLQNIEALPSKASLVHVETHPYCTGMYCTVSFCVAVSVAPDSPQC